MNCCQNTYKAINKICVKAPLLFFSYLILKHLALIFRNTYLIIRNRDFPGSPVVKTSPSNAGSAGSIPGQGIKIPHASRPKHQNIKQKQYCNKFNKDFKNGPHQKNL